MSDYAEILSAAVQLPPAERELLIKELSATLIDEESVSLSPEWIEEIERRSAEIDAGAVELVDWEIVRKDLFKRVGLDDRA
jgi:putative addiction module component (TIGR02574 family)